MLWTVKFTRERCEKEGYCPTTLFTFLLGSVNTLLPGEKTKLKSQDDNSLFEECHIECRNLMPHFCIEKNDYLVTTQKSAMDLSLKKAFIVSKIPPKNKRSKLKDFLSRSFSSGVLITVLNIVFLWLNIIFLFVNLE